MREQQQFLNHFSETNSRGTALIDKTKIYIMRLKCYLYHGFNIHSGINLIIRIGCDFNITHHLNISSGYYVSFKSILLKYMHLLMAIMFLYLDNACSKCMPILTYNVVSKTSIQLLVS